MTMFSSLIDEIQNTTVSGSTKRQLSALTRITDLFVTGSGRYSKQQIELFDEVFKTLVAVIELKTRIKLARHLATIPNAPASAGSGICLRRRCRRGGAGSQPVDGP